MVYKKILIVASLVACADAMVQDEPVSQIVDLSGLAGPIDLENKILKTDKVSDARVKIAAHYNVDPTWVELIAGNKISHHADDHKTIAEVLPEGVCSLNVVIHEPKPQIEDAKKSFYRTVLGVYRTEIVSMQVKKHDRKLEIDVSLRYSILLNVKSDPLPVETLIKLIGFFEQMLVSAKTDQEIIEHGEEQVRAWCEARGGQYPSAEYEQDGYVFALEPNKVTIRKAGLYRAYDEVSDTLGDMMGIPQPPSEPKKHHPVITINATNKPLIFAIVAAHLQLLSYISCAV